MKNYSSEEAKRGGRSKRERNDLGVKIGKKEKRLNWEMKGKE